jgi:tubulin polyglutamylase TTLL4
VFKADNVNTLSLDEVNIMVEYEEESSRKGQFSRVFPLAANVDYYEKFFEETRYFNLLLWSYLRGGNNSK